MAHSDRDIQAAHERRGTPRDDSSVGVIELDHVAVRERLSEYLEESLSESEHERIREHLEACPSCRAFRNTLDRVIDLAGQLPARRLPDEAKRDLLDRVRDAG